MTSSFNSNKPGLRLVPVDAGAASETFELRDGNAVIGTLRYDRKRSSRVEAEEGEHRWALEQEPFAPNLIKIYDAASRRGVATYEGNTAHTAIQGSLRFVEGRHLYWVDEGNRGQIWLFQMEGGQPIVRFQEREGQGLVADFYAVASQEPHLPLLLLLGYHLRRLATNAPKAGAANWLRGRKS